jgi:hypothetical protein
MRGLGTPTLLAHFHDEYQKIVALYAAKSCSRAQAESLLGTLRVIAGESARAGDLSGPENDMVRSWPLPDLGAGTDGPCGMTLDLPALPATQGPGIFDALSNTVSSLFAGASGAASSAVAAVENPSNWIEGLLLTNPLIGPAYSSVRALAALIGADKVTDAAEKKLGLPTGALWFLAVILVVLVVLLVGFKVFRSVVK